VKRFVEWYDEDGEIHKDMPIHFVRPYNPKPRQKKRVGFTDMYGFGKWGGSSDAGAVMIAKDKELRKGLTLAIYEYLKGTVGFNNYILTNATIISRELDINDAHVRRSLRLLKEKGVIIEGPSVGNARSLRLNPNYYYKGNPSDVEVDKLGNLNLVVNNDKD